MNLRKTPFQLFVEHQKKRKGNYIEDGPKQKVRVHRHKSQPLRRTESSERLNSRLFTNFEQEIPNELDLDINQSVNADYSMRTQPGEILHTRQPGRRFMQTYRFDRVGECALDEASVSPNKKVRLTPVFSPTLNKRGAMSLWERISEYHHKNRLTVRHTTKLNIV
jgi:hypothetical protein